MATSSHSLLIALAKVEQKKKCLNVRLNKGREKIEFNMSDQCSCHSFYCNGDPEWWCFVPTLPHNIFFSEKHLLYIFQNSITRSIWEGSANKNNNAQQICSYFWLKITNILNGLDYVHKVGLVGLYIADSCSVWLAAGPYHGIVNNEMYNFIIIEIKLDRNEALTPWRWSRHNLWIQKSIWALSPMLN